MSSGDAERPALSVVIGTLGHYDVLARVLDGYEQQSLGTNLFEVIVVADAADPNPAAVDAAIGRRPYSVRRLTGEIPGASANRNVGWTAATAPVVVFTDNDTIPVPLFLAEHLAWHRRNPQPEVAVTGPIRWAKEMRVTPFMKILETGIQFDFRFAKDGEVSWSQLYSGNGSIKREFLERVGGYDQERLPYLYEDLDWAIRARDQGLRVLFDSKAVVDHVKSATIADYQARAPQLARAEWTFTQLHPEIDPWFHRQLSNVYNREVGGRSAARAVGVISWRVPWLGPRIWNAAKAYWLAQMAPPFMAEWNRLEAEAAASTPAKRSPAEPQEPDTASAERSSPSGS